MSSTKIAGYVLSIAGLAVIALSNKITELIFKTNTKGLAYTALAGVVLIVIGIVLVMADSPSSSSKVKQAAEEVPIYEGEGKKRRIVGYKKAEK
jgi:formate hydrogenlyase subunit 4